MKFLNTSDEKIGFTPFMKILKQNKNIKKFLLQNVHVYSKHAYKQYFKTGLECFSKKNDFVDLSVRKKEGDVNVGDTIRFYAVYRE